MGNKWFKNRINVLSLKIFLVIKFENRLFWNFSKEFESNFKFKFSVSRKWNEINVFHNIYSASGFMKKIFNIIDYNKIYCISHIFVTHYILRLERERVDQITTIIILLYVVFFKKHRDGWKLFFIILSLSAT